MTADTQQALNPCKIAFLEDQRNSTESHCDQIKNVHVTTSNKDKSKRYLANDFDVIKLHSCDAEDMFFVQINFIQSLGLDDRFFEREIALVFHAQPLCFDQNLPLNNSLFDIYTREIKARNPSNPFST